MSLRIPLAKPEGARVRGSHLREARLGLPGILGKIAILDLRIARPKRESQPGDTSLGCINSLSCKPTPSPSSGQALSQKTRKDGAPIGLDLPVWHERSLSLTGYGLAIFQSIDEARRFRKSAARSRSLSASYCGRCRAGSLGKRNGMRGHHCSQSRASLPSLTQPRRLDP